MNHLRKAKEESENFVFPGIDHLANTNDVCVDKGSLRNRGLDTKACHSPAP